MKKMILKIAGKTTIKQKLYFGFGGAILMVLVVGLIGILSVKAISSRYDNTINNSIQISEFSMKAYGYFGDSGRNFKNYLVRAEKRWEDLYLQDFSNVLATLKSIENKIDNNPPLKDALDKTYEALRQYDLSFKEMKLLRDKSNDIIDVDSEIRGTFSPVIKGLLEIDGIAKRQKDSDLKSIEAQNKKVILIIITLVSIALITGITMIYLVIKSIIPPIQIMNNAIENMSKGDLRSYLDYNVKDELGKLAENINKMIKDVSNTVNNIVNSASNIGNTIDILKSRSEQLTKDAQLQAEQNHQIAASAEEMGQTIQDISRSSDSAAATSSEAISDAKNGVEASKQAVNTVHKVYESTVELSNCIETLNKKAQDIGTIITVINEIADQTNLLALNAAIEAARAGEQGRGFAIVADEVRKLAEKTIKATSDISSEINGIQKNSVVAVNSMKNSSMNVSIAKEQISSLGQKLENIMNSMNQTDSQISHIATAIEEQSAASNDVVNNITKSSELFKDMVKMITDINEQIVNLTSIGDNLRRSVAGFTTIENKVMSAEIAKIEHRQFMELLERAIQGDKINVKDLPECLSCSFGQWHKCENANKSLCSPHHDIHKLAEELIQLANKGDLANAKKIFKDIKLISDEIIIQLERIKKEGK